jgi:hypothetical protein
MIRRFPFLALLVLFAGAASAGPFSIRRIVDDTDDVPGTSTPFDIFHGSSTDRNGDVAFLGTAGGLDGVYLYRDATGTIVRIADNTEAAPGASPGTNFRDFGHFGGTVAFDGGRLAFGAEGDGELQGIYEWSGGTPSRVVDDTMTTPNGGTYFPLFMRQFDSPWVAGDHLAFTNFTGGAFEVYAVTGGTVTTAIDGSTPIPGSGGTTFAAGLSMDVDDDGTILFFGADGTGIDGLYTWNGGTVFPVMDTSTAVPGFTTSLEWFGYGSGGDVEDDVVVALVRGGEVTEGGIPRWEQALVRVEGGVVTTLIDSTEPVPGCPGWAFKTHSVSGGGTLNPSTTFHGSAYDRGITVFLADIVPVGGGDEARALFADFEGWRGKVLGRGDTLDGKTVRNVQMHLDPLAGPYLAVEVWFMDDTNGVYRITFDSAIPEPGTIALVGLGLTGLLFTLRRRHRRQA